MSDDTPSPLNNVIMIGDERHLERVVRDTVEETLNALLASITANKQRRHARVEHRAAPPDAPHRHPGPIETSRQFSGE
jgi:hypothetical protein